MTCQFCMDYINLRMTDRERERRFNLGQKTLIARHIYRAAFISVTRRKNDKGKWHDAGKYTLHSYKLKYCPSCGRLLKTLKSYKEEE